MVDITPRLQGEIVEQMSTSRSNDGGGSREHDEICRVRNSQNQEREKKSKHENDGGSSDNWREANEALKKSKR